MRSKNLIPVVEISYKCMCQRGHIRIGFTSEEECPLCLAYNEMEVLRTEIRNLKERVHDSYGKSKY